MTSFPTTQSWPTWLLFMKYPRAPTLVMPPPSFANCASLPDFEPCRLTAIAQVLRRSSERSKRIYHAAGSDRRVPGHVYMRDQLAVGADHDVGADDAIRTDRGALSDHSAILNPRGGIDHVHQTGPVSINAGALICWVFRWLPRHPGAVQ